MLCYVSPIDINQSTKHSINIKSSFKSSLSNDNDSRSDNGRWNIWMYPSSFPFDDHKNQRITFTYINSRSPEMINNRLMIITIVRCLLSIANGIMNDRLLILKFHGIEQIKEWKFGFAKINKIMVTGNIYSFVVVEFVILSCFLSILLHYKTARSVKKCETINNSKRPHFYCISSCISVSLWYL